ncbi:MAG: hypothetical protein DRQ89_11305 [Epsilonproteobacteria bacterium]|nr:MAG: hypothetical protein DRQ89_11305 [Campylobacterota bacterium]
MERNRLEAFSDGVIAIIITILVLELNIPKESNWAALFPVAPVFGVYILSFIYLGIYWNNHHHMFQTVKKINGKILWANLNFLFWLSTIPFVTGWMGESHFAKAPTTLYGIVLLLCALSYTILQSVIIKKQGEESLLLKAIKKDSKGKATALLYLFGIVLSFFIPWVSGVIYVLVAVIWLIPDKRIEKVFN